MYAPSYKTMDDLNGRWHINKSLSDSTEPVLALQGIGWLTRKAISAASITVNMKQYKIKDTEGKQPDASWEPLPPAEDEVVVYQFDQMISGGLKGTTETRVVSGLIHSHSDWLFGSVESQHLFRTHAEIEALPDANLAGKNKNGPWIDEGKQMITTSRSPNGWVATQVWGFQMVQVNGKPERRFCRNVTLTKGKDRAEIRLVHDWDGELQ